MATSAIIGGASRNRRITSQSSRTPRTPVTAIAVASVLFQGVIVSSFSYFAWFWLMRRYLASQLAVLSFMTPLFGVLFGVLILDEPLTAGFLIGTALVLAGISLVSGADWLRRHLRGVSA